jgi:hypothetical protein
MKQKQKINDRPERGDEFVILVDSPYWPPGTVMQFVVHEWWYGHDCLAEFEAANKRSGCTTLAIQRAPQIDGRGRYLTNEEVRQALKARRLLTPEREAELAREEAGK